MICPRMTQKRSNTKDICNKASISIWHPTVMKTLQGSVAANVHLSTSNTSHHLRHTAWDILMAYCMVSQSFSLTNMGLTAQDENMNFQYGEWVKLLFITLSPCINWVQPNGLTWDSLNCFAIFTQPPYSLAACLACSRLCLSNGVIYSQRLSNKQDQIHHWHCHWNSPAVSQSYPAPPSW